MEKCSYKICGQVRGAWLDRSHNHYIGPSTSFWHNYTELREKFPDYFILMQMGDFYEAFEKDAEALRDRYGYTVTTRTVDNIGTRKIMSGFPAFMLDNVT